MTRTLSALIPLVILFLSCGSQQSAVQPPDTAAAAGQWEWMASPSWYNAADFDTIRVATWNIEHFVDDYDNPYIDHPRENEPAENLPERRRLLAEALMQIDADVVVFQEVESRAYIETWMEEYLPEMGYRYATGLESSDWYMNVIIMSRLPLGLVTSYANAYTYIMGETADDGTTDRQRFTNNRMVSVDVHVNPGYHFMLTGVHLKAGRGSRNEGWRIGQINLLREHYTRTVSHDPNSRILVAGDLNTLPGDREFNALLGGETGLRFVDPLAGAPSYTHTSNNPTRQLDHLIPNDRMAADMVPGSAHIPMPFDAETMRLISDHLPVVADFVTR
ncbi:MAG: endonuclease/exonuclease/phosphatase family protein [Balneolaceae bacterium]